MKKIFSSFSLLFLIVLIGGFLRFYNPLWDNGLFLHPDERLFVNASTLFLPTSWQQFFSYDSPLNPHMFYYGSFLLYLYKLLSLVSPFSFLMTSRMVSAFFSALTIGLVFGIGKKLFSKKVGILSSIIFAFAAGSIQYAHFNTTESSLIFFIAAITYVDILCVKRKDPRLLLVSLLLVGIATAIKITGLIYSLSPFLAALLLFERGVSWKKITLWFFLGTTLGALVSLSVTPYQFIDFKEFSYQTSYMQAVTYGIFKPPFVIIYQGTIPYVYQTLSVFPYYFGFLSFPLALLGVIFLGKAMVKNWRRDLLYLFVFVFPILYFAWSGVWFAKYARYYLLLLPFLSVWAGYALRHAHKYVLITILFLIALNGLLFFRIYTQQNTRITASEWIYRHIPYTTTVATEHWDDALPLLLPGYKQSPYKRITLHVYDAETQEKIHTLSGNIAQSDYIILSSRRVSASILKNASLYPQTNHFYTLLFTNKLGFEKVYEKTFDPFLFSDNLADETFQSYDHPPVVIYKNIDHLSKEVLYNRIALSE